MKRQTRVIILIVTALGITAQLGALDATITDINGKVEIRSVENGSWAPAEQGMTVPVGATISTSFNASALVQVGESVVTVNQLTRMRIDELVTENGTDRSDLNLRVGRINADVRGSDGNRAEFRVRSPIATASVRGTNFSFDGANLTVLEGIVVLANRFSEASTVGGGGQSTAAGAGPPPQASQQAEAVTTVSVTAGSSGGDEEEEPVIQRSNTGSLTIDWEIIN